jgi:YD repeat-containing protein
MAYNTDGTPQSLTTPYGTTGFSYLVGGDYRWISISEPNGGRQVYAFRYDATTLWSGQSWLPSQLPANLVPGNLPPGTLLDNTPQPNWGITGIGGYDTFHWDQNQSAGLPADPAQITPSQMNKARTRHWLLYSADEYGQPDFALSIQIDPCPTSDGATLGQVTWFGYPGQEYAGLKGASVLPSLIARKLPDGSTWYESYQRNNVFGQVTSKTTTYGTATPPLTRTYTYVYDSNGQDLLQQWRPGSTTNELVRSYTYDANGRHQPHTETQWPDDAHSYTTTRNYDAQSRLQSEVTPAGLTRTYNYSAYSGTSTGYLYSITDSLISRTEYYSWDKGNVRRDHPQPARLPVQRGRPAAAPDLDGWHLHDLRL